MTPDPRIDILAASVVPMWVTLNETTRDVLRPGLAAILARLDATAPRETATGWREVGARLGAADPTDPYVVLAAIDEWEALGAQHADEAYRRGKAESAPEVISGVDAEKLPDRTVIGFVENGAVRTVYWRWAGQWYTPDVLGSVGGLRSGPHYVLLHRPPEPEPARTFAVNDKVETDAEMSQLEVGTAVRGIATGVVAVKKSVGLWDSIGDGAILPARVIDLSGSDS
jgi:hypothetical protein